MITNAILLVAFGAVSIFGMFYAIWQLRPTPLSLSRREIIFRAVQIGVATWIFIVAALTFFDLLARQDPLSYRYLNSLFLLACFSFPFGAVAGVGGFVRLSFIQSLRNRATKKD